MSESKVKKSARGPYSYENWRAALEKRGSLGASEYPLFTDAHITGEIREGCGPYLLLNAVPLISGSILMPAVTLRMEHYLGFEFDPASMQKTDVALYHGGLPQDELAALVSLTLGIRVRAGGSTRRFEPDKDPRGSPEAFYAHENPVLLKPVGQRLIIPRMLGDHDLNSAPLLFRFAELSAPSAGAIIHASRIYQDAAWIAEAEPELAWIMFVSAMESAAGHWRKANESPAERLRTSRPELEKILLDYGGEALLGTVANSMADYMGATRKFIDFVQTFLPQPPAERPAPAFQHDWDLAAIRESMRVIYGWRSKALHSGIPFPAPMCIPPIRGEGGYEEKPHGLATSAQGGTWVARDTPMNLHTFEYIARGCLKNWWESMLPAAKTALYRSGRGDTS